MRQSLQQLGSQNGVTPQLWVERESSLSDLSVFHDSGVLSVALLEY